MKILHICSDYFNTEVYDHLFSNLENLGIENTIFVPSEEHESKIISYHKRRIIRVYQGDPKPFSLQLNKSRLVSELKKYVKNLQNFSVIHAHYLLKDGILARELNKKLNLPIIISVRSTCISEFSRYYAVHNLITSFRNIYSSKKLIFQSVKSRQEFIYKTKRLVSKNLMNNSEVISNGINSFWFKQDSAIKTRKSLNRKEIKFISAASIEENKNLLLLADTIEKINELKPYQGSLTICGKILDHKIYEKLLEYSCVKYMGEITHTELKKEFENCDIFILLSHRETFGLVYAEALSQGLPVIYSRNQGFDGQFAEGFIGYSCESTDQKELIFKIDEIIFNFNHLFSNTQSASQKFQWKYVAKNILKVYEAELNR